MTLSLSPHRKMTGSANRTRRRNRKKRDRRLGEKKYDEDGKLIDDRNTEAGKNLGFKDIVRENALFEKYYKAQQFCSVEEFGEMMSVLRTDLPASFRITGTRSQAESLLKIIEGRYFKELTEYSAGGGDVVVPRHLPWYPGRLAYQLNVTRKEIRRQEIYFRLHNFLVAETESGSISRQETVSMLPPLVLGVQSHHAVLDMCAAPGSKTAQLVESVMDCQEGELPTGLVVANDSDNARCYMLTHQVKRLQSPCIVVTNHDASIMPNFLIPDTANPGQMTHMKFDRILCDVPCTGDGTLRKNADIWPKWNPVNSVNLHGIQHRIAKRGLELLAVGGRMVYSTCSLHPAEDEAVIARLLQECGGSVRLVEVGEKLPGLQYSPGLTAWSLGSKKGELYQSFQEVPEDIARTQIRPHMFPPPPEVVSGLGLEKCVRLLPHHHNTGGFFLALLEKTQLCPWESAKKTTTVKEDSTEDVTDNVETLEIKKDEPPQKRFRGFREDPFVYFNEGEEVYEEIQKYYDLTLPSTNFLIRTRDPNSRKNNIYFTTAKVRDLVENNTERVKIINTGVKAFARADAKGSECDFRIAQEGALSIIPFIKERKVLVERSDMVRLLQSSDFDKPPEISVFTADFQQKLENMKTGSLVYLYRDETTGMPVEIVGWKGKSSVRAYVPKNDRLHYLRLMGEDTSVYETNKFEEKKIRDKERLEARERRSVVLVDDVPNYDNE